MERIENMTYDEDLDEWICANNNALSSNMKVRKKQTMGTNQ
jgi:hypothetical protein